MIVAKLVRASPVLLLAVVGCVGVIPDVAEPAATTTSIVVATTLPAVVETTMLVEPSPLASTTTTTQEALLESVPAAASLDNFAPRVFTIDESLAATVAGSWRVDCPVPLEALRLVQVRYWDFDEAPALGWLVVHADVADDIGRVFEELYSVGFPIQQIQLVDVYGNDDDRSMEANNTSAFNCRTVGGSSNWSEHAYGRAIDLNPLVNPFVTSSGNVFPPDGARFVDRALDVPGLISSDGPVVKAFGSIGWEWGGNWDGSKDYQHFSENGR